MKRRVTKSSTNSDMVYNFFGDYTQYIYIAIAIVVFIFIANMLRPQAEPPQQKPQESSWWGSVVTVMIIVLILGVIWFAYNKYGMKTNVHQGDAPHPTYLDRLEESMARIEDKVVDNDRVIRELTDHVNDNFEGLDKKLDRLGLHNKPSNITIEK